MHTLPSAPARAQPASDQTAKHFRNNAFQTRKLVCNCHLSVQMLGTLSCPPARRSDAPLPLAARNFSRKRVELRLPETAELIDPSQHRPKPRRIHRIEPPLRLRPNLRKGILPQYLEVLRHRRLRDPELGTDCLHDFPR